jgi:hypothetical protein
VTVSSLTGANISTRVSPDCLVEKCLVSRFFYLTGEPSQHMFTPDYFNAIAAISEKVSGANICWPLSTYMLFLPYIVGIISVKSVEGNGAILGSRTNRWQIPVPARSRAWTIIARSNTGILGSNSTQGMDVSLRLFCVCVALCVGSSLATGWSPSKESYRLCMD